MQGAVVSRGTYLKIRYVEDSSNRTYQVNDFLTFFDLIAHLGVPPQFNKGLSDMHIIVLARTNGTLRRLKCSDMAECRNVEGAMQETDCFPQVIEIKVTTS